MRAIVVSSLAVVAAVLVFGASPSSAQTPVPPQVPALGDDGQPAQEGTAGTDLIGMGVSLGRIRRELREVAPSKKESVLRLDFHVDVYGKAPKIDILKGVDVSATGAVRYGGMTHNEFLDLVTPPQFRNQPNYMGALQWLLGQLNKKSGGE